MFEFISKLRHFDAYPKPLEDFRIKTISGALISTITAILAIILFIYEWHAYTRLDLDQELFVDLTRNQRLTINLNMTFAHLPCGLLSVDAMDVSGEHQNDVVKGLKKIRLDRNGNVLSDELMDKKRSLDLSSTSTLTSLASGNVTDSTKTECMSCYGAEASNHRCCNTCDDVRAAYRQKNWHFSPFGVEQCKKELEDSHQNVKAAEMSRDAKYVEELLSSGEGCQIYGHLEVNKVAGNFHIAPGVSYQQNHMHVHDIKNMPLEKFNTKHHFDLFSFGQEYPNQFNPLEKKNMKLQEEAVKTEQEAPPETNIIDMGLFQLVQEVPRRSDGTPTGDCLYYSYFLKVVPTVYEYADGRLVNNTYQYSVTKSVKSMNGGSLMNGQLPGVFVNYELSAIMVKYIERSKSFTHFLTSCCAIIGGLFTIAGMLDAITFRYWNIYKKYQLNKLT